MSSIYQSYLQEALLNRGADVRFAEARRFFSIVRALIRNWKPDVFHLDWISPFYLSRPRVGAILRATLFLAEILIAKAIGVRIAWTIHNDVHHERRHLAIDLWVRKSLASIVDIIQVSCEYSRQRVFDLYELKDASKVHVVPIEGPYAYARVGSDEIIATRRRYGLPQDAIVFLFFGNIRPYKGLVPLLHQFRKINRPRAYLLVAGIPWGEELANEVKALAEDAKNVVLDLRFVTDEETRELMAASDCVVLPYESILNSGVLITAMSCSKPIVGPRLGCIPEIAGEANNFLYDPHKQGALLEALRQSMEGQLCSRGAQNQRRIQEFTWDEIANRLLDLYENGPQTPISTNSASSRKTQRR